VSKFEDIYGSGKLTAKTLAGEIIRTFIENVELEDVRDLNTGGTKPRLVLTCRDLPQTIVLNATNARAIAAKCGTDETLWRGAEIEISTVSTQMGDGIGITVIAPPSGYGGNVVAIKPDKPKPPTDPGLNDAVPF
jgi:hypothetical protein